MNSNIGFSLDRFTRGGRQAVYRRNKFAFAYSYKLKFSELTNLRLGFQILHIASKVKGTLFSTNWGTYNDYSFGFVMVHKKFKIGGSLTNLSTKEVFDRTTLITIAEQTSYFVFNSSYEIRLNSDFNLLPMALVRLDNKKISLIDLTTYLSIRNKVYLGFTYRDADDDFYNDEKEWIALIGVKFWKKLNIQMSFNDYNGSDGNIQFLAQLRFQ